MTILEGIYLKVYNYIIENCDEHILNKWNKYVRGHSDTIVEWAATEGYSNILKYLVEECDRRLTKNLYIRVCGEEKLEIYNKIEILDYIASHGYIHKEALINWAIILNNIILLKYGEKYINEVKILSTYKRIVSTTNNECVEYIKLLN